MNPFMQTMSRQRVAHALWQKLRSMSGATLLISCVLLLVIMVVGIGMIRSSSYNQQLAANNKKRIQAFYATDGIITLLSQEAVDNKANGYLTALMFPVVAFPFEEAGGSATANLGRYGAVAPAGNITSTAPLWVSNACDTFSHAALDFGTVGTAARYAIELPPEHYLACAKAFTIAGWLNCRDLAAGTGGNRIVHWYNGALGTDGEGIDLVVQNDGKMRLGVNQYAHLPVGQEGALSASSIVTQSASAQATNWVFFAVTYDSSAASNNVQWYKGSRTVTAYSVGTNTYKRGHVGSVGTSLPMAIGNFSSVTDSTGRMFKGIIDNIRIYASTKDTAGELNLTDIIKVQRNTVDETDTCTLAGYNVEYSMVPSNDGGFDMLAYTSRPDDAGLYKVRSLLKQHIVPAVDAQSLTPPDTYYIPVTYYDFHENQSCPEFSPCYAGPPQDTRGWVQDTLDAQRKPIVKILKAGVPGQKYQTNYYIKYWFRPWAEGAQGDYTAPRYDHYDYGSSFGGVWDYCNIGCGCNWTAPGGPEVYFLGYKTLTWDTAYKNVVIKDSIRLVKIHPDTFQYRLWTDTWGTPPSDCWKWDWGDAGATKAPSLHPLNSKGYGKEGQCANYVFTMEVKTVFVKKPGQYLYINADDDFYAFVNRRLAYDHGGIQHPLSGRFNIDSLPFTLDNYKAYDLDLFWAQRAATGCQILIKTNIVIGALPPIPGMRTWKRDYGNLD